MAVRFVFILHLVQLRVVVFQLLDFASVGVVHKVKAVASGSFKSENVVSFVVLEN